MRLTFADVAAATGGRLSGGMPSGEVGGISIDSRTLSAGDMFVAIRGDRFDGHRFLAQAFARGAAAAVVDERGPAGAAGVTGAAAASPAAAGAGAGAAGPTGVEAAGGSPEASRTLIRVGDTTKALQDMARDVRRRSGAKVVAITGSAGKTTTKEVAAGFLAARHAVYRNRGNLNNHIGLPLSLLELRAGADVAVVELGMNHAGEIRTLVGIAEPEVRVWTNVGDAHLGFFDSPEAIADAKAEILEGAGQTDVLVANADDPLVAARTGRFAGRVVRFGTAPGSDVRASSIESRGLEGTSARVTTPAGAFELTTPLLGMGNLSNVLAATAVALEFDVPLEAIAAAAARLTAAPRRGEVLRLPGGLTLIDDSYNSSPAALRRALEAVAASTGSARKVAVLGEMLELGDHALPLHEACGAAAAAAGLQLLVTVGGAPARALAEGAVASGMPAAAVLHVPTSAAAADVAAARTRPGDLVLVKGSRGIGTDAVVDRLKAEFA